MRWLSILALLWIVALLSLWPASALGPSQAWGWLLHTGPPLLRAAALLGAAWGAGWHVGRGFRRLPDALGQRCLELALGLMVAQSFAVLVGAVGLLGLWSGPLFVLVGLPLALRALRIEQLSLRAAPSPLRAAPSPLHAAAWMLALGLLIPSLFGIGAPPTQADELQYHLRLPELLLGHGGVFTDPEDPVSAFPRGLHVLLALLRGLGPGDSARPFALLLGFAGVLTGQRLAVRLGGPLAGALALPIILGAPTLLRVAPTVNSDLPMALFVGVALLALAEHLDSPSPRFPLLLGLLGATAFSIKFTAALYFAPIWAVAMWTCRSQPRPLRALGLLGAATLLPVLFAAPWLISNAAAGLHPLYPVLGIGVPEGAEAAYRFNQTENYGAGAGLRAWLRTPWDLFVFGTEFDRRHYLGRLGMVPLLALPGVVLATRDRAARGVLLSVGVGFLAWAGPLRRVAYLMPLWPALAAVSAVGIATLLPAPRAWSRAAFVGLALLALGEVGPAWTSGLADAPVATGRVPRDQVLAERAQSTGAWRYIEEHAGPDEPVATAFVWEIQAGDRRVLWTCAEECPTLRLRLLEAGSGRGARAVLEELGVRWMLVRRQPFLRTSYPALDDATWETGYARPLAILDELLSLYGARRFDDGPYSVYEFPPPGKK